MVLSIIGNLGRDAAKQKIGDKEAIVFSIAENRKTKDGDKTTWVSVISYNVNKVLDYLKKGTKVFVCGDFILDKYTDKDGVRVMQPKVIAYNLQLLGSSNEQSTAHVAASTQQHPRVAPLEQDPVDDLPF